VTGYAFGMRWYEDNAGWMILLGIAIAAVAWICETIF
jgi:hypothetical protein